MKTNRWRCCLGIGVGLLALWSGSVCAVLGDGLKVDGLRCEYRVAPLGMDVTAPRLSWLVHGERRGERQIAYRVLVASSPAVLEQDRGDLWDSEKVESDATIHVVYRGRPMASRAGAFWKVRAWDRDGQPSAWSDHSAWTMGLLAPEDWRARWIADPDSVKRVPSRGGLNGYHSAIVGRPDASQWVTVDLGREQEVDGVRLFPARPYDWQPDTPGFLFPRRFRIEVSSTSDFGRPVLVVDRTAEVAPNPGTNAPEYRFDPRPARYARLSVTELACRDGTNHAFALAEFQVLAGGRNVAAGRTVIAHEAIENGAWAGKNLVDGVTASVAPGAPTAALPATLVRKNFRVEGTVRRALAYVTGLGLYELRLNGRRVGDQVLAPEWTNYRKRIQYQTIEVTDLLQNGANAVGASLGEGWYAGRLMVVGRDNYGSYPRFLFQLEIEYTDGRRQTVVTDGSWRTTTDGPIRSSGIYDGEVYDARKEMPGWDTAAFDDGAWQPARDFELGSAQLVWQRNEPIRVVEELKPIARTSPKPGVFIFDFGQNMVGRCRLALRAPAGGTIQLRHGEMVESDGSLYTANLRGAPQVDRYTARGDGLEVVEPHFTYHGFRYLEVSGLSEPPGLDAAVGRVFYSSAPDAGRFECSDARLNRLMRNIYWTQRGNLMSSPNDCPQRDERFGWMGDIQAFSQTAIFNMDMAAFFSKWVRDIRDDQAEDGRYPDFAPHPGDPNQSFSGVPAWGDAGTFVPWRMYLNYGDTRLLEEHFESARQWVEYVRRRNPDLIWSQGRNNDYNDWLNGDTLIHDGWPRTGGSVPKDLFATAFFARSTEIVAGMAQVLGRTADAETYGRLHEGIKAAFNRRFVQADGSLTGDTQAGYALALRFDLLSESLRPEAARRMVAGLARYGGHLSTGIQSSHRFMLELNRNGYAGEAYRLLNLTDFPSWGMMVENGATTIWERWDGYVKGRGFQDPGMNSFNHWAFGAVGEWVWRHVAGIQPEEAEPGYRSFSIAPQPGGGIDWVKAAYPSLRGPIVSEWRVAEGRFELRVEVPANTRATVRLPVPNVKAILESGQPAWAAEGVESVRPQGDACEVRVASGRYSFTAPWVR